VLRVADDSDLGHEGPPSLWDEERRFQLRAEIDAAFFHLYGLSRDDAAYVLDTFPIVRRNDESHSDEYRTKRVILERYDATSGVRTDLSSERETRRSAGATSLVRESAHENRRGGAN